MAQDIVSGLFGQQPWEIQQAQQAALGQAADKYAGQSPIQQGIGLLYRAGGGMGDLGAGMFGLENPAIAQAQQRQTALQGLDASSSDKILAHAQTVSDPRIKMQLMMLAQDMKDKEMKRRLDEAHAKYYEQGGASGATKPLSPAQIEMTYRQALRLGSERGLKGAELEAYAKQAVSDAINRGTPSNLAPTTATYGTDQNPLRVSSGTDLAINAGDLTQEQKDLMLKDAEARGDTVAAEAIKQIPVRIGLPSKAEATAEVIKAREAAKMTPTIPPKALAAGIAEFRTTGKMPALGFGSAANRMAIIEGAAKQAEEEGKSQPEEALRKQGVVADRAANAQALNAVTKDISAIEPYEKMLNTNANIAKELAKKVVDTDVRLANKTLNWLRQNAGDYPDTAEFLAQMEFVSTEAARVLNNPRLTGQLTVQAKREMKDVISGDMPINSLVRVLDRIMSDGANRVNAMKDQQAKLRAALSGAAPASAPASAPAAPAAKSAISLDAYLKSKGF